MHGFCGEKETPPLQIDPEMIETAFHFRRQFEAVDEPERFRSGGSSEEARRSSEEQQKSDKSAIHGAEEVLEVSGKHRRSPFQGRINRIRCERGARQARKASLIEVLGSVSV